MIKKWWKSTQNNEFLKLDRNGDVLSNFLSNFNSQLKDPTRFSFFKVDAEKIEASVKMILNHVKTPTTASESMLRGYKSPNTFPIEAKMSNVTIKTDARISFRPDSEGDVILAIHGILIN